MGALQIIAAIFAIAAIGGYVNRKSVKLPKGVGMLAFSSLLSVCILVFQKYHFVHLYDIPSVIEKMDFSYFMLHGILSLLLFAGALHVNVSELKDYKYPIFSFSTFGVAASAAITGYLVFAASSYFGIRIPLIPAMLFGVLIASTDAIFVMEALNQEHIPKSIKTKIVGEALFNDGTSIVLFMALSKFAYDGHAESITRLVEGIAFQTFGGIALGLILAALANFIISTTDDYDIEIAATIALATGAYALGETFGVSAAISTVVAGLYTGNKTLKRRMSDETRERVNSFWTLVDEILNSILFVLMGLVLVLVKFNLHLIMLGAAGIVAMLVGRYLSLLLTGAFLIPIGFDVKTVPILMTWGGIRGGISLALAFAVPNFEHKHAILAMTYMAVIFSVVVQGTTFGRLVKKSDDKSAAP